MKNKGQFFFIAAFAIIVVIFSLGEIYNYALTSQDPLISKNLAKEIKTEGTFLINKAVLNNYQNTSSSMRNLTSFYSLNYPDYNITVIYSQNSTTIDMFHFYSGVEYTNTNNNMYVTQNNITLSLNNRQHIFNLTKGYVLFVVTEKQYNDETFISKE